MADTLYSLGYFSESEASDLLELFASEQRPLTLPDFECVEKAVIDLYQAASEDTLNARASPELTESLKGIPLAALA